MVSISLTSCPHIFFFFPKTEATIETEPERQSAAFNLGQIQNEESRLKPTPFTVSTRGWAESNIYYGCLDFESPPVDTMQVCPLCFMCLCVWVSVRQHMPKCIYVSVATAKARQLSSAHPQWPVGPWCSSMPRWFHFTRASNALGQINTDMLDSACFSLYFQCIASETQIQRQYLCTTRLEMNEKPI